MLKAGLLATLRFPTGTGNDRGTEVCGAKNVERPHARIGFSRRSNAGRAKTAPSPKAVAIPEMGDQESVEDWYAERSPMLLFLHVP